VQGCREMDRSDRRVLKHCAWAALGLGSVEARRLPAHEHAFRVLGDDGRCGM